jgi:hypothetical protein
MVERLVRQILTSNAAPGTTHFQFRICTEQPFGKIDLDQDAVLISPILER